MKMFNMPSWLKPEINEPKYWVHLVILSAVALYTIDVFYNMRLITSFDTMFNIKNILLSVPALALGDLAAHTSLGLN